MNKTLKFKWTVSRGQNTYGYNICSLWVDGVKVSSCNGGGYDMEGTALGNWMETAFKDELVKLDIPMNTRNGEEVQEYYGLSFHNPNFDPGKAIVDGETVEERERSGKSVGLERYQAFHFAGSKVPTDVHTIPMLDGACGKSCMEKVLNAIGYKLEHIDSGRNHTICRLTTI